MDQVWGNIIYNCEGPGCCNNLGEKSQRSELPSVSVCEKTERNESWFQKVEKDIQIYTKPDDINWETVDKEREIR